MRVHIVVKTYSNGASANYRVCSSAKKARKFVDMIAESAEKDGWKINREDDHPYLQSYVEIVPENTLHAERFHVESFEVR